MFEDDLSLLEAFSPLIGRGRNAPASASKKGVVDDYSGEEEGYFQFGLVNVVVLVGLGVLVRVCVQLSSQGGWWVKEDLIVGFPSIVAACLRRMQTCYHLGAFQGENIPEFVITQQDLWYATCCFAVAGFVVC
jgi:hypothetical protein